MIDYNYNPYYDRYSGDSEHRKKGYTKVLARPSYVEQASEFNEIQSIQRDYTERLGNAIFKDGYIISGCGININDTFVTVASGQIFLDGLVRNFDGQELNITGIGVERLVAYVETTIVTENDDASLRDPAQGAENYGLAGAYREKQVVKIEVVNEDDFTAHGGTQIYSLQGGVLVKEDETNDYAYVTDTLAERTYDENGNFKIQGIKIKALCEIENEKIKAYITEGKAYVKGYEVAKPSMTSVLLNPATATRTVQSESHFYYTTSDEYKLSNGPIAEVKNLTCLVSVIGERKSKGSIVGDATPLNNTPVDSIIRVYSTDSSTTYQEHRDYELIDDQIDWSLSGDSAIEPPKNSTFYVDYVYNKAMELGKDYTISNRGNEAYITFLSGGLKPDNSSRMYISYTYTLARRDLLLLDSTGIISVLEGDSDKIGNLLTPYNGSPNFLELGYVDIYPTDYLTGKVTGLVANVTNYDSVRFTQDDIYSLLQRVETLELDMADLDLEREITDSESSSSLKGYFTDNFLNINKVDFDYQETVSDKVIKNTACIDYTKGELTTSANINNTELVINDKSSDSYATYGTIISAPYEYELALKQSYKTGTMLVNPYASYGPMCQVILSPSVDNWIDNDKNVVYNTIEDSTYEVSTNVYSHGYWSIYSTANLKNYLRTETYTSTTKEGTTVSNAVTSSVAKTLYEYMRSRIVKVTGRAFGSNMADIYCTFGDKPVSLAVNGEGTQGTGKVINGRTYNTVCANENGSFEAQFTIPTGIPCGKANVILTGTNTLGEEYSGQAIYTATGTLLTTTITNTTTITQHYKVLNEVHNLYANDPLAQSFILSDKYDRSLVKLNLYFATKSTTRPAVVQVRGMTNGYPSDIVYAEVSLPCENVKVPTTDGVAVATEVILNQPVYCTAGTYYCFVVLSDSNEYSMFYANMGDKLIGADGQENETLVVNPYSTGVMFSSSNSSTWTAHQGSDLMFELYRSRYTGSGEIIFDEIDIASKIVTGLILDASYEDNANNGLAWKYRYALSDNSYSDWLPTDTLIYRDLQNVTDKIQLKAIIATDYSTSPFIDAGRISLKSFIDDTDGTYISKHLTASDFDEEYQSLRISYQACMPSGASHNIFYKDTESGNWIEIIADSDLDSPNITLEKKTVDDEFEQYTWIINKVDCMIKDQTSKGSKFFKLRIDLNTTKRYNRPRIRKLATIFKYNY